ncbi:MAG: ABC transporter permease subunit [Galactobacter sp.]
MSAATLSSGHSQAKVSLPGILRSEWRKFFSLRSTWILSSVAVAIVLIFAAFMPVVIGLVNNSDPGGTGLDEAGVPAAVVHQMAVAGLMIGGLLWAAAVIVSIAGEFSSHSIVSTFAAVPTRTPVYLAKSLVTGVVGFLGGVVFHLISALLVVALLAAFGFDAELGGGDAVGEALLSGVYVLVLTWMAVGLAALMRSTAGAIVVLSIFVYLVTSVVQGFTSFVDLDWLTWIGNHLPTAAVDGLRPSMNAFLSDLEGSGFGGLGKGIAAWDGWLTVAVWALAPLLLGGWAFKRRGVR